MADASDWESAYRHSRYAWPDGGAWRSFSLEGEESGIVGLCESLTLITAWNPNSEEHAAPWNEAANARLLRAIVADGRRWSPAWGGSLPGVEPAWREEGFALHGLFREEAVRWGREWGQRALVWAEPGVAGLLTCADERFLPCGVRLFS